MTSWYFVPFGRSFGIFSFFRGYSELFRIVDDVAILLSLVYCEGLRILLFFSEYEEISRALLFSIRSSRLERTWSTDALPNLVRPRLRDESNMRELIETSFNERFDEAWRSWFCGPFWVASFLDAFGVACYRESTCFCTRFVSSRATENLNVSVRALCRRVLQRI